MAAFALAGCTGDEFSAGEGGNTGASSSSDSGSTTSTGAETTGATTTGTGGGTGECPGGCIGEGVCREGISREFCGADGGACSTCVDPEDECQRATCAGGTCGTEPRQEGALCQGGAGSCQAGLCVLSGENCVNGIDDEDQDTDVDCQDADCAALACSAPAPAKGEWAGPFVVLEAEAQVECPVGLSLDSVVYAGPTGACECGAPTIGDCTAEVGVSTTCVAVEMARTITETCGAVALSATGTFGFTGGTTETSCTAAGAVQNGTSTVLTTCQVLGGGCDAREACLPPLEEQALLCIRAPASEITCPGEFPLVRRVWLDPQVGCDCDCTVPGGCVGEVDTFTDTACTVCEGGEDCPTFEVADPKCKDVVGTNGPLYAQLRVTAPGTAEVVEGPVEFTGEQAALYCCQDYPLP